jgi:hypothetical protein
VPAIIDGETFYFDIDTGMPPGIFFPDGLVRIKNSDEYQEIMSDEEAETYHLVKTNTIQILDETYTGQFVMTNSIIAARSRYVDDGSYGDLNDLGMVGIDFLKYYDFLFDYRDLRNGKSTGLYYEPNTPLEDRNYGFFSLLKEAPELGILNFDKNESGLLIRSIIKASIAYKTFGFRPGTIITKINGKPIAEISQEELIDPSFYFTVENYTTLEDDAEQTIFVPSQRHFR